VRRGRSLHLSETSELAGASSCSGWNPDCALGRAGFPPRTSATHLPGRVFGLALVICIRRLAEIEMPSDRILARMKPPGLQPGDTVGIVAPASNVKRELLQAGCETLRSMGYKPFYFDSILDQDLYFAGSAQRRARELEEMFVRDEVRAIVCARGGYGSNYLLDLLDLNKIKAHPIRLGWSRFKVQWWPKILRMPTESIWPVGSML